MALSDDSDCGSSSGSSCPSNAALTVNKKCKVLHYQQALFGAICTMQCGDSSKQTRIKIAAIMSNVGIEREVFIHQNKEVLPFPLHGSAYTNKHTKFNKRETII